MLPKIFLSDIIFLPVILAIGFITTCEDFRSSKIRNKWVAAGLLYAILAYALVWVFYVLYSKNFFHPLGANLVLNLLYAFDKWLVNLFISILVAYFLWYFKLWGAGDAKLFICFSALIPISRYPLVYFKGYFASYLFLLAIFLPATLFLLLKSTTYFSKRLKHGEARQNMLNMIKQKLMQFNLRKTAKIIFGFFVLFLFFRLLTKTFSDLSVKFLPNQQGLMLACLFAFKWLTKFFKRRTKFVFVIFIILCIYIVFEVFYSQTGLILGVKDIFKNIILLMVLFPLLKNIINLYVERTMHKNAPFAIWIFLGALIIWFF